MNTPLLHSMLVGAGGFAGALMRYGLGGLIHRHLPMSTFPVGTLVVNLSGCFLIGIAAGLIDVRQLFGPELRVFLLIGILGGFTTFSTFGYETFAMVRNQQYLGAAANAGIQVLAGLLLVWAGYLLATWRWQP